MPRAPPECQGPLRNAKGPDKATFFCIHIIYAIEIKIAFFWEEIGFVKIVVFVKDDSS
jgi:hypothetical protein